MAFVHTYGSISDALALAAKAGAGQGFQQAFQNQMSAEQSMHAGQNIDNAAIGDSIQTALAYDRLHEQQASDQAKESQANSQFQANQLLEQGRLKLGQDTLANTKSYQDQSLQQAGSKQADLNDYRGQQLQGQSDNLDLKSKNLDLQTQMDQAKTALMQAQQTKVQDYGEQYLNTSAGKLDMQRLHDLEADKAKAQNLLTAALGEKARSSATSVVAEATRAYNEQYAALQSRLSGFADQARQQQQQQSQALPPATPPATVSGQPKVDPRQQQQTSQAVMGQSMPQQNQSARPLPSPNAAQQAPQQPGGGNGRPIDKDTAKQYLQKAGGDVNKAKAMAAQDGWVVQ